MKPEFVIPKFVILSVLAFVMLPFPSHAAPKNDFTLSLTLTMGERSRDSHAETTLIRLAGNTLTYEQTYSGYGASRREPVSKEFKLKGGEIEGLKNLIKEQNLLGSGALAFAPAAGQHTYFELDIKITLKGIIATQELSAPRRVANVKEEKVYQKSTALLRELYRLINLRAAGISYREPAD